MTYILAIDQGTTSSRAIIFSQNMDIVAIAQKELTLFYPENGWVEQNADDIWQDTVAVCHEAIKKAGITAKDIASIGITNQRETTIVWDKKTGKPVYNAIVWQDRRTSKKCQALKTAGHVTTVQEKTGLLIDSYFSATKIEWILDNVQGARARADQGELLAGTVDCFLIWKLTGGQKHVTDATNASRTLLYNIRESQWDEILSGIFNVPVSMMPAVLDNVADFGKATPDLFDGVSIPICGVAGDQQAALIGQACFKPGMVKSTYGTGCFALMNIGDDFKVSRNQLLTTIAYQIDGQVTYAIEGSIFIAGAAVQWLRDQLGIIKHARETSDLAQSVDDNGGVYLMPAFTGLGAPHWDPDARAVITGLTRGSTKAHIARAALEAQAYQTRDLVEAMEKDAGQSLETMRVDGGMVENNWMCQFLADMTGVNVERPPVIETTALGAAYLAAIGAGLYLGFDDITKAWEAERRFKPSMNEKERADLWTGWQKAVRASKA